MSDATCSLQPCLLLDTLDQAQHPNLESDETKAFDAVLTQVDPTFLFFY